jgi:hypothetical protein
MQAPRGSPIMRAPGARHTAAGEASLASMTTSMFGPQRDSRKRSTSGPAFVPFGGDRGRWTATASARFYSLNVAATIRLGHEGHVRRNLKWTPTALHRLCYQQ